MKKWILLPISALLLCSCATNKQSRYMITGASIAAGALGGSLAAPSDERKELHSVYWAAIAGLIASLVSQEIYSDAKEMELLKSENARLQSEAKLFKEGPSTLLKETQNKKSKIKLYKIDKWVDDGPHRKIHQDQMIEITPLEK